MTWHRFLRRGSVRAERLAQAWAWTTDGGDPLVGRPGDWRVTDGRRTWTVVDASFRASYEPVPGGFRRRGAVRARAGRAGELVATGEGPVVVRTGDWVVDAGGDDTWVVPPGHFCRAYVRAGTSDGEGWGGVLSQPSET